MTRWYGKFFGLIAGWMLLRHPAGGLIGLLVGHAFDADWFKSPADNPYRVFGLAEDASDAELDLAYRRLILMYHPPSPTRSPSALLFLTDTAAREINTAYDRIKELRRK